MARFRAKYDQSLAGGVSIAHHNLQEFARIAGKLKHLEPGELSALPEDEALVLLIMAQLGCMTTALSVGEQSLIDQMGGGE